MEPSASAHNAASALDEHLRLISADVSRWIELFADDAVVEFPYAAGLGVFERLEGRAAIWQYFKGTPESFRDLELSEIRRYTTTDPDVAIAEVHGSATIGATGQRYEQDYVMVVKTRAGKIVLYREYWNPTPAIAAFGGVSGLSRAVSASA
jgi:uncharacterized protein